MTPQTKTPIGTKIKFFRKAAGLSQRQIASILGIQPATYCKYENNVHKPKEEMVQRIADILLVNIIELYDENLYQLATLQVNAKTTSSNSNSTTSSVNEIIIRIKQLFELLNYKCYLKKDTIYDTWEITIIGDKGAFTLDQRSAEEFLLNIDHHIGLLTLEQIYHQSSFTYPNNETTD
ncbi:MAG: helix-turn-helix transcriptional regulator [Cellulosilyticum sp.]|nr:helix-turn-helix transcriptional regulator [Cellulosilyticum sp.]